MSARPKIKKPAGSLPRAFSPSIVPPDDGKRWRLQRSSLQHRLGGQHPSAEQDGIETNNRRPGGSVVTVRADHIILIHRYSPFQTKTAPTLMCGAVCRLMPRNAFSVPVLRRDMTQAIAAFKHNWHAKSVRFAMRKTPYCIALRNCSKRAAFSD